MCVHTVYNIQINNFILDYGHSCSLDMWSTGSWLGQLGHSHTHIRPSAPELEIRAGDDDDDDDNDDDDGDDGDDD